MKTVNPEIIEPRLQPTSTLTWAARGERAGRLLYWMLMASLPALVLDGTCAWLLDQGRAQDVPFAWLLLIVFIVPAALATLVIGIVELAMFGVLIATLFGRDVIMRPQFRFGQAQTARRPPKTVS